MNTGKSITTRKLQTGESVILKTKPKTEQLEFYSTLLLKNNTQACIKLTAKVSNGDAKKFWSETNSDIFFEIDKNRIFNNKTGEEIMNDQNSNMFIKEGGLIVNFKGEKTFNVTDKEPMIITITNVSNKEIEIGARIENH